MDSGRWQGARGRQGSGVGPGGLEQWGWRHAQSDSVDTGWDGGCGCRHGWGCYSSMMLEV